MKKYLAEFIGTFIFALAIAAAAFLQSVDVVFAASVSLMLLVYIFGPISGAHVNPAVTLGFLSMKMISARDALGYIVAQILGGALALGVRVALTSDPSSLSFYTEFHYESVIAELLGATVLVFGIVSALQRKVDDKVIGLVIAAALFAGVTIGTIGGFGVINPAVSLALMISAPQYLLAPLVGGILGAQLSLVFADKKKK